MLPGIIIPIIIIVILLLWTKPLFVVPEKEARIIERLGKFARIAYPGLNVQIPWIEKIREKVDLRQMTINFSPEIKTSDDVYALSQVSVQYRVDPQRIEHSVYSLENPREQIESYVGNSVRSSFAKLNLQESYIEKDKVAHEVQGDLSEKMKEFGFEIVNVLIENIVPDVKVKEAMNGVKTSALERDAARLQAEGEKAKVVAEAEADAEAMKLRGSGIANQRQEIVTGLSEQFKILKESGLSITEINSLILSTQYFETLSSAAGRSNSNVVFVPTSSTGATTISEDIRNSILSSKMIEFKEQGIIADNGLEPEDHLTWEKH